jgi:hypothetical protein
MRKILKWSGIVLLLAVPALWALSRWMPPSAEQRQALEVLAQRDVPEGRNAFAAIWFLPFDVPEEQLETVLAEDVEKFRQTPTNSNSAFRSVAEERFNRLDTAVIEGRPSEQWMCILREKNCLEKVRADAAGYAQWKQQNLALFERAQALSQYDYFRYGFPPRLDMPFPSFTSLQILQTMRAVDFSQGRTSAAVDGACRDLGMWRKLTNSDMLVSSMVAVAGIHGTTTLLAQMMQELPAQAALPDSCSTARTAATVKELSLCNAMRHEAAIGASVLSSIKASPFYDSKRTQAMSAPTLAWACSQAALTGIERDEPLHLPPRKQGLMRRFTCISNSTGCIFDDIASPVYDYYLHRSQDTGAKLNLLATLLWLREHTDDKRPLTERLAARPDELKSPTRDIEITADGKALSIRMFEEKRGPTFQLPLPVYLQ